LLKDAVSFSSRFRGMVKICHRSKAIAPEISGQQHAITPLPLADNMRAAINMAWDHGGADFQSRFDKSTAQAIEMKKGRCGFYDYKGSRMQDLSKAVRHY
jgi:hypothetical protein